MAKHLPLDWKVVYPNDIISGERSIVSGPFGSNIGKRFFVESGIPVIRGNNLTLGKKRFVDDGFVYLTEEKAKEFKNCQAVLGDIVFTAAGTLGQVGVIPKNSKFPVYIISNKQLRLRPDPNIALSCYLYYWFSSEEIRNYIIGLNTGSSVPLITLGKLRSIPINLPPLPTQRKIAAILSSYDDLIENNLRRIKILEEMAQNLYREWFVKFRFPGHENAKFVDSPLGLIPEGWEVKTLGDICIQMQSGGTPSRKKNKFWEFGDIDWYKTMELCDKFLLNSNEKITISGLKGSSARLYEPGTILMAIYGSPTVGRLGIVTKKSACNQAAIGMIANPMYASQQFLFYALYELRTHFNSIAQGVAQQNISKEKVSNAQCILPAKSLMDNFKTNIVPIWSLLENIQKKNQQLRQTRDLLLPKLISGEVDVSELDIAIPEENKQ